MPCGQTWPSLTPSQLTPLPGERECIRRELDRFLPTLPSVLRWDRDRTTDRVRFNRPAIERVAAEGGPNQAMAKLLVAARAEGASSRWPF